MNRAWVIALTDLRLFLRDKSSFVWLFVVPLAFMYFMGVVNKGPGTPSNPRPSVRLEAGDTNFLGAALLRELDAQGMRVLSPTNQETAERAIRIPWDLTENVLAGRRTKIGFEQVEGSADTSAALIEARLLRAIMAFNTCIVEAAITGRELNASTMEELQGRPNPVRLNAVFAGHKELPHGFNQSLPGVLVMMLMMNLLIFGGAGLAEDRRNGVLRRLMANSLGRRELVAGKMGGVILLGAVQSGFFLLCGRFIFGVHVGSNLLATLLTLLVYVWVASSFGLLIGSLIVREDQIVAFCVLASMIMAALGGCWWPLEIVPDAMRTFGHAFPSAWAMDALNQLISFGGTLGDAATSLAVMVGFAAAASVATVRWFRV